MRKTLFVLSLLAASAAVAPAHAGDVFKDVLEGQGITGTMLSSNGPNSYCHSVIRTARVDGKIEWFIFPQSCKDKARNYVDIGWPLFGPAINMKGIPESHLENARMVNGHILLR